MTGPDLSTLEVGHALPSKSFPITRGTLVRYAGASGDFNVIHWNERVATDVGLPNVIAHGMLTMGLAIQVVTDWVEDPSRLIEYGCRFTRPVIVPDDGVGALLEVSGKVSAVEDGEAVVTLSAVSDGVTVLGKATARVRID
jgi:acyl dehydratase